MKKIKCGVFGNYDIIQKRFFKTMQKDRVLIEIGLKNVKYDKYLFIGSGPKTNCKDYRLLDERLQQENTNSYIIYYDTQFLTKEDLADLLFTLKSESFETVIKEVDNSRRLPLKTDYFIRSGTLDKINKDSIQWLSNNGYKTIIDFKHTRNEQLEQRFSLANIKVLHPCFGKIDGPIIAPQTKPGPFLRRYVSTSYMQLLRQKEVIKSIFKTMANGEGKFLICCKYGKDRTGITCMLLEMLSGKKENTIIRDYLRSFYLMQEHFAKERPIDDFHAYDRIMHGSQLRILMDKIKKEYGSAESFLLKSGLSQDDVAALKRKLKNDD
jgi:arsenate reductase-like glutaredoxin family protein